MRDWKGPLVLGLLTVLSACTPLPAVSPEGSGYRVQQTGILPSWLLRLTRDDPATETEIRRLNDQARSLAGGFGALDFHPTLQTAARAYSRDLANGVASPRNPIDRVRDTGMKLGLAYFYVRILPWRANLAADLMKAPGTGWLNDAGSRPVFLHDDLTDIGVGAIRGRNGRAYVTVVLVERTL
ncbi:MAG: CAP domain-containing protein [Candidatus Sericytochromatia bacterium]